MAESQIFKYQQRQFRINNALSQTNLLLFGALKQSKMMRIIEIMEIMLINKTFWNKFRIITLKMNN